MTLDDLTALIERDLPGWGWLVRNVPEHMNKVHDWEEKYPERSARRFFANLTSPEFDHSTNRDVRDPKTGNTVSFNCETGYQTAFPRYSDNSGVEALLSSYCWALETKLGTEAQDREQSAAANNVVSRLPDRFARLYSDGRPTMPEDYSEEIHLGVYPGCLGKRTQD